MANQGEVKDILWPALQVGGLSGVSGFTVGAFAGVLRSTTPTLFALASGLQWFALGSTYWASRAWLINSWGGRDNLTHKERIQVSSIAGAIAGSTGGLIRGRRNIIPGIIMFGAFGAVGQALYNTADEQKTIESKSPKEKKTLRDSWLNGKWSPMKVLSDEEYKNMLEENLLKIEVQIGEVEENIEAVRRMEKDKTRTVGDSQS